MRTSTSDALVDELQTELGDDLRLVARYDADDMYPLYVRDDVDRANRQDNLRTLHSRVLDDHQRRSDLESALEGGELQANLLVFREIMGTNFLGSDYQGHVTTTESDIDLDLKRYLRRFQTTTAAVRQFSSIKFEHTPAGHACPRCGNPQTISTPEAGPGSPYYCLVCDASFS